MQILYSVVARETVILAEYSTKQGTAKQVVKKILQTIAGSSDMRKTYFFENYYFHYEVSGPLIFLCITDDASGRTLPFTFLNEVKQRFLADYADKWQNAITYAAQTEFGRILRQLTEYYSNITNVDQVAKVQGAISEVKEVMIDNIDKVLARGTAIEDTIRKTDEVAANALTFRTTATRLKRAMWWKNVKMMVIICVVVLLVIYIIAAITCSSPTFAGCRSK